MSWKKFSYMETDEVFTGIDREDFISYLKFYHDLCLPSHDEMDRPFSISSYDQSSLTSFLPTSGDH